MYTQTDALIGTVRSTAQQYEQALRKLSDELPPFSEQRSAILGQIQDLIAFQRGFEKMF